MISKTVIYKLKDFTHITERGLFSHSPLSNFLNAGVAKTCQQPGKIDSWNSGISSESDALEQSRAATTFTNLESASYYAVLDYCSSISYSWVQLLELSKL